VHRLAAAWRAYRPPAFPVPAPAALTVWTPHAGNPDRFGARNHVQGNRTGDQPSRDRSGRG